jgi:phospholipid/cholesterol/gamma-HCH transport system substrate-binding protein
VVGDKFLLIHAGSDSSPKAAAGFTLRSKEPIEMSAMLAKASGMMDKADTMLTKVSGVVDEAHEMLPEVRGRVDGVLESLTNTVQNANGLVTEARSGNGVVGTLLSDQGTADQVKQIVGNAQQATAQLNQSSTQLGQMVTDFQSRNLPAKVDDSLTNVRQASQQVNQISQQVGQTVTEALGPDNTGISAGQNLRETLSNVNSATGNLSDDTEALKHNFLFRGFFKKRGYYSLAELSPQQYRVNTFFQNVRNERFWLNDSAFTKDTTGTVVLSEEGQRQVDQLVGDAKDHIIDRAIVVEGYSNDPKSDLQIEMSQLHAQLIARYLEKQFHLNSTDIRVVVLNSTPPPSSGKTLWGGASVVLLASKK